MKPDWRRYALVAACAGSAERGTAECCAHSLLALVMVSALLVLLAGASGGLRSLPNPSRCSLPS